MRIGEVAAASGVPAKTLRFYEDAGLLPAPERTSAGYRNYDADVLPRLRFIRAAQACGLTLAEIRQIIVIRQQTGPPCAHVRDLLDAHAHALEQRVTELTGLLDELRRLRDRADRLDPAACGERSVCHVIPTMPRP